MRCAVLVLALAFWPAAALAGLTEAQIGQVAVSPPPGARVPTAIVFKDLDGRDVTLGDAIAGRSTLMLPADFTCSQICGPALSIAAGALSQTGLQAGRDYSVVVVGIDANDSIDDARRFTSGQVGGPGDLAHVVERHRPRADAGAEIPPVAVRRQEPEQIDGVVLGVGHGRPP